MIADNDSPRQAPTSNGTTHACATYTDEQLAQLTYVGVTLRWEDLDAEDRLERILANPRTAEWYNRAPYDHLGTLADFRHIAPKWGQICEQFAAYKGNPWRLEKAVDQLRQEARPASGAATATFPEPEPIITTLADYDEQETTWLWWPYLAKGALAFLDGDPGVGKSLLTIQLAACLSRGWPLPDQQGVVTLPTGGPQRTLLITAEDSVSRTIKKRCRQAGGDDTMIDLFTEWQDSQGQIRPFTLQSVELLDRALAKQPYALVVIDPIQAFLGDLDMHRSNETRPVLQKLAKVLERHDVTALCIRHPAKPGQGGGKAIYRGLGSIDFMGAARTAVFVEEHPNDDTTALVCQTKTNLDRKGRTLVFSKAEGLFEWKGVSRIPAEVLAGDRRGPDPHAFLEAFCWLEEQLRDGIPRPSADLEEDAKEAGVKHETLKRAKKALGVRSIKHEKDSQGGTRWDWQLPSLAVVLPPPPQTTCATSATSATCATRTTRTPSTKSIPYEPQEQGGGEAQEGLVVEEVQVVQVTSGGVRGRRISTTVLPLHRRRGALPQGHAHPNPAQRATKRPRGSSGASVTPVVIVGWKSPVSKEGRVDEWTSL